MSEVQKICVGCSMDVSHSKRVKDTRGRYYCPQCAAALKERAAARASPAAKPDADVISLDDAGELDLGEVRGPARRASAAASRTPATRKPAPPDAGGELDLAEVRQPERAASQPMFACANCKKIVPDSQIKNDDGEFLCHPCFEKRHAKTHAPHKSHPPQTKPPGKRLWPFK